MKPAKRPLYQMSLGILISLIALFLIFVARIMQLYSVLNWNSAVKFGLQNGSFKGDPAAQLLARKEWGYTTHRNSAIAFAVTDCTVVFPLLITGCTAVIMKRTWGYALWFALGIISVYFSILMWVVERKYTYPSCGPLVCYTYYWEFFLYWRIGVSLFSFTRLCNLQPSEIFT